MIIFQSATTETYCCTSHEVSCCKIEYTVLKILHSAIFFFFLSEIYTMIQWLGRSFALECRYAFRKPADSHSSSYRAYLTVNVSLLWNKIVTCYIYRNGIFILHSWISDTYKYEFLLSMKSDILVRSVLVILWRHQCILLILVVFFLFFETTIEPQEFLV